MDFIQKIHNYLDAIDKKYFYRYLIVLLVILVLSTAVSIYYFYSSVDAFQKMIDEVNDVRTSKVASILSRIEHVKKQRSEVNEILAQDEAFKIGGYFNDILGLLNIASNKKEETTTQIVLDDDYRESMLSAKFVGLTMKQLTELLNIIEQNRRVYTKALEIQKAIKPPKTIDVLLTIATLQPRTAETE